jgi:hypothetical protein
MGGNLRAEEAAAATTEESSAFAADEGSHSGAVDPATIEDAV